MQHAPHSDVSITQPEPGVAYPQLLRRPGRSPLPGLVGVLGGLIGYLVIAGLFVEALLGAWWVVADAGPWTAFRSAAIGFENPAGMLAGNLSIALLIPIAALIVRGVHGASARCLISVEQRVRWRWLAVSTAVALVAFGVHLVFIGPSSWSAQEGFVGFLVVIVLTTPLQAMAEEVFFRGYLMQAVGGFAASPWWGILGSSTLFALFHGGQSPALFFSRFAFGIVAGWLVVRTGGLETAVAAHIVNNVLAWLLAAGTTSIAEVRAITHVTWADAFSDVAVFAGITLVSVVLVRGMHVRARTPRTTVVMSDAADA